MSILIGKSDVDDSVSVEMSITIARMAKEIANTDDESQAEFFNKFAESLSNQCGDYAHEQSQISWIAGKLNMAGAKFFRDIVGFLEIKQERADEITSR